MDLWILYALVFVAVAGVVWAVMPDPSRNPVHLSRGGMIVGPNSGPFASIKQFLDRLMGRAARKPSLNDELSMLRPGGMNKLTDGSDSPVSSLLAKAAKISPVSEERAQELNGWLAFVGSQLTAVEFNGLKVASGIVVGFAFMTLIPGMLKNYPFMVFIAGGIGFVVPELWLRSNVARRHKSMLRLLPEVIDLLSLCMGAGLDFLGALNRVIAVKAHDRKRQPLLDELSVVIQEIKFGKRRAESLKSLAKRVNLPELSSFVRTLVQADRMGTPINEVLATHAEDVRFERFQRAERAALKAPIKILVPLIFCILPCVAIIVGAPIFLQFSNLKLFPK